VTAQTPIERLLAGRAGLKYGVICLFGAATMLSFSPVGWHGLGLVLVMPLLWGCLSSEPRTAGKLGFWYGCGLFLAGTYWLYTSIHVFGKAPLWVAIFLMLGLVVIMGLYYMLTCWSISLLAAGSAWRMVLAAPAAWTLVEWVRGWFLSGFPWMTLGYGQIDSPLAAFAPVFGVYGVSAMLLLSAACVVAALGSNVAKPLLLLLLAALPWLAGLALEGRQWTQAVGEPLRTTIVQGGVPQDRKWLPEQFLPTLNLYSNSLPAHANSDLVVWPEVAIPASIDQVPEFLEMLDVSAARAGQTLLLGILERDLSNQQIFNSVIVLGGPEQESYRKRHLVPFGEMFPVPDFVREWMRLMSLPHSDMTPGDAEQQLLMSASGVPMAVAICYEDAYGAEQLYALPSASILINVSNDAWFGDSIAPHQHLEIARMRALEAGRFVVRATNNGVSAFIAPDGRLLETGPQFQFVSMTRDVVPYGGLTPYARLGNWPVVLAALLSGLWLARGAPWRRENNQ